MSVKKISLLIVLFSGILGCECFSGGSKWNIDSFEVSISDKNYGPPVDGMLSGDSIGMTISFEAEFVALNVNPFSGLMTSAYATSCEEPGDRGLEDKITSFTVTSSSAFNDIPNGESLNEFLALSGGSSISDWIDNSDGWNFNRSRWVDFVFTEKPEPTSIHRFTLRFALESGTIVEQTTEEIQWND